MYKDGLTNPSIWCLWSFVRRYFSKLDGPFFVELLQDTGRNNKKIVCITKHTICTSDNNDEKIKMGRQVYYNYNTVSTLSTSARVEREPHVCLKQGLFTLHLASPRYFLYCKLLKKLL